MSLHRLLAIISNHKESGAGFFLFLFLCVVFLQLELVPQPCVSEPKNVPCRAPVGEDAPLVSQSSKVITAENIRMQTICSLGGNVMHTDVTQ